MFTKSLLVSTLATPLLASSALAGPYVRGEATVNLSGSQYSNTEVDLLGGYEEDINERTSWWIEAGPSVLFEDGGGQEVRFKIKSGINYTATEQLDLYGEIGTVINQSTENDYYGKAGFKYKF